MLSVDEKSQIQALDRTQPGLPLKRGRGATMTHDYKRNGTTTLFAALNVLDGSVIGRNMQRHRHHEFIRLLNTVEAELPPDKAVHVILDNYATHKQPRVHAWLDRHPRWTFHFVPTSCSWLNAVEGFFAKLRRRGRPHWGLSGILCGRLQDGMEGTIDMAIDKDVLDQLLAGRDPQDLFAKDGLLDELKKALSERMLSAELDDHLKTKAPKARSTGATDRRGRRC